MKKAIEQAKALLKALQENPKGLEGLKKTTELEKANPLLVA